MVAPFSRPVSSALPPRARPYTYPAGCGNLMACETSRGIQAVGQTFRWLGGFTTSFFGLASEDRPGDYRSEIRGELSQIGAI